VVRHTSETGKTSPLDFLAQASAFQEPALFSKWTTNGRFITLLPCFRPSRALSDASPRLFDTSFVRAATEGREKITVVAGPGGPSLRLHKGNGRLPPMDLTKPFAKKCRNRECNNLSGQVKQSSCDIRDVCSLGCVVSLV
jgi:hypothetical protein